MSAERARLFVAVDLEPPLRAALAATARELAQCGADARWTRPEALHLTVKFLGAVPIDRLAELERALVAAVAPFAAQSIAVRGLGVFPDARRPRIVWAGVEAEWLRALAEGVEVSFAGLDFAREERAFRPHLTLARLRSRRGWEALRERLESAAARSFGSSEVKSVDIFRSDLRSDGAVYTKLCRAPLARSVEEGGLDGS